MPAFLIALLRGVVIAGLLETLDFAPGDRTKRELTESGASGARTRLLKKNEARRMTGFLTNGRAPAEPASARNADKNYERDDLRMGPQSILLVVLKTV